MKNELLERAQNAWAELDQGERRLLIIGAVLVGLALLYTLLWRPVQTNLDRLRARVPAERAQLQQMRSQIATIKPLRARSGAAPAPGMLLSVVDQSATTHGLRGFISRLEAEGGNSLQLVAEAMPFNTFIAWLADLQDTYTLIVESAAIGANAQSGTVNIKMKLRTENP